MYLHVCLYAFKYMYKLNKTNKSLKLICMLNEHTDIKKNYHYLPATNRTERFC